MWRFRRIGALGLLALALLSGAIAVGCGGADGEQEDRTARLNPAQILERSREAAGAVRFYRPRITATLELTARPGSLKGLPAALAGAPITITAEGPVRRPIAEGGPAFSFDLAVEGRGLTLQGSLTKLADAIYLSVAGQDFRLGLSPEQAMEVRIPPQPALFVDSPTEVGREEINGAPTVHLQGAVATDSVVDYLVGVARGAPGLLGAGEPPSPAEAAGIRRQLGAAVRESQSDVWIGTGDLLPHRVAATLRLEGPALSDLLPGVTGASLDVRADVRGFDEEAEIAAPASPTPLAPGKLPGLGP